VVLLSGRSDRYEVRELKAMLEKNASDLKDLEGRSVTITGIVHGYPEDFSPRVEIVLREDGDTARRGRETVMVQFREGVCREFENEIRKRQREFRSEFIEIGDLHGHIQRESLSFVDPFPLLPFRPGQRISVIGTLRIIRSGDARIAVVHDATIRR